MNFAYPLARESRLKGSEPALVRARSTPQTQDPNQEHVMRGKIFTPDEANQMLPLVQRIVDDIIATYRQIHVALGTFEEVKRDVESASGATRVDLERELRYRDAEVSALLDAFQGLIEEIEALGGTVKDYEAGAVDFYGDVDGEIVYLCWMPGDDRVEFWHPLEDGYGKRRPLPASVAAS